MVMATSIIANGVSKGEKIKNLLMKIFRRLIDEFLPKLRSEIFEMFSNNECNALAMRLKMSII